MHCVAMYQNIEVETHVSFSIFVPKLKAEK